MPLTQEDFMGQLSDVATGLARLRGIDDTAPLDAGGYRLQFDEWDWEIGVGLYGLYRHAQATDDKRLIDAMVAWYDWQIERGLPHRQVNSTAPMLALVFLLNHVDRPDWEALAKDWAEWLMDGLARTEDGGFQHVVKERLNEGELWDDTLFMTCLFLAQAGVRFGRQDWVDEAIYQFMVHTRYLSDPETGLWYHGWTFKGRHNFASAFWARGNAWITIAIPELFGIAPDMPGADRRFLTCVLQSQVNKLAQLQNGKGFFHTLLDDPNSPIEASATAGIAYGVSRGVELGLLDRRFTHTAICAREAVMSCIGEDGIVAHVSDGTPMGHSLDFSPCRLPGRRHMAPLGRGSAGPQPRRGNRCG